MAVSPTPHSELAPTDLAADVIAPLAEAGWKGAPITVGDVVYLNARRFPELPDVDADALREQLTFPPDAANATEELIVQRGEKGSIYPNKTYVFYKGSNRENLGRVVRGMVEFGEQADTTATVASSQTPRGSIAALGDSLRAHLPLEIGGSVAVLGVSYVLMARRNR